MENQNVNTSAANDQNSTTEIDLGELLRAIWHRIWLVLILVAAGIILSFAITKLFITPKYEAKSTIYILSKSTSITSLADLQIGSNLAADFEIIATTRELLESVIAREGLDMTYEELRREISVSNPTNSHMLVVSVLDPDAEQASRISNAVADELRNEIADIMNTDRPSTVEQAIVPVAAKTPNVRNNIIIGGVAGLIIAIAIITIIFMSDDTIKNADDVRKYLELDTLAAFPLVKTNAKPADKRR